MPILLDPGAASGHASAGGGVVNEVLPILLDPGAASGHASAKGGGVVDIIIDNAKNVVEKVGEGGKTVVEESKKVVNETVDEIKNAVGIPNIGGWLDDYKIPLLIGAAVIVLLVAAPRMLAVKELMS